MDCVSMATGPSSDSLQRLAEVCEQVAATASKLEKRRLLAGYLASLGDEDLYRACTYLTGRALPPREPVQPGVGGSLLWKVLGELARGDTFFVSPASEPDLGAVYRRFGDLGDAAEFLLTHRLPPGQSEPGKPEPTMTEPALTQPTSTQPRTPEPARTETSKKETSR